ncbi:MAG: dicarboxylate/amino acid:cation symporter [Gemmatimonadales bacterium]|jgi:proton glutamate symport protein|nr:dicarboxylate/amino acid:cation symporter [Gemmatimonadales bacterium]
MPRLSLTAWIIIATLVGLLLGWLDHDVWTTVDLAAWANPLSTIFLRMIKSIVAPLLFASLVVGIAGHGDDLARVGRLALKSLIYFEVVTTIALFVGLGAVHLTRPGVGVQLPPSAAGAEQFAQNKVSLAGVLEHTVPSSIFEAMAKNEVLQIVFFSLLFGIALAQVKGKPRETMLAFCESLTEIMFKFTGLVMKYAPIGIGAAVAVTVGRNGLGVLRNLGLLVGTLYGALIVFVLGVLLPVALLAKVPIRKFWKHVKEPWLIAFSTASSEAAFPMAMQNMEKMGVPKHIVSFVLPTGYSFNLDGSTLYLAVASIFVAQAAGVDMPLGTQLVMMLTLMLTSKGVAAVPRASLVILAGTLTTFGLPLEGIAVILGVDAFMDMARTSVNLLGNCLASVVMARWEGEFDDSAGEPELPVAA